MADIESLTMPSRACTAQRESAHEGPSNFDHATLLLVYALGIYFVPELSLRLLTPPSVHPSTHSALRFSAAIFPHRCESVNAVINAFL